MDKLWGTWKNTELTNGFTYICGYCGIQAGPSRNFTCIAQSRNSTALDKGKIYICPNCNKPTFIDLGNKGQMPGPRVGADIEFLPVDVEQLYNEARNCIAVNAFTSSILSCRKLLMNVAVSKDAEAGKSFAYYVKYLEESHFTPPNSRDWVDHIRSKGNEATHEIPSMSREDAIELLDFTEMLLRFVYEMPGKMARHTR